MPSPNSNDDDPKTPPSPIPREVPSPAPTTPEPPIKGHVTLPEKVAVTYLAEVSGQTLETIAALMDELRIIVAIERSVDFADAARILRRYGIAAEKTR